MVTSSIDILPRPRPRPIVIVTWDRSSVPFITWAPDMTLGALSTTISSWRVLLNHCWLCFYLCFYNDDNRRLFRIFGLWRVFDFNALNYSTSFTTQFVTKSLRIAAYHSDCHCISLLIIYLVSNFSCPKICTSQKKKSNYFLSIYIYSPS